MRRSRGEGKKEEFAAAESEVVSWASLPPRTAKRGEARSCRRTACELWLVARGSAVQIARPAVGPIGDRRRSQQDEIGQLRGRSWEIRGCFPNQDMERPNPGGRLLHPPTMGGSGSAVLSGRKRKGCVIGSQRHGSERVIGQHPARAGMQGAPFRPSRHRMWSVAGPRRIGHAPTRVQADGCRTHQREVYRAPLLLSGRKRKGRVIGSQRHGSERVIGQTRRRSGNTRSAVQTVVPWDVASHRAGAHRACADGNPGQGIGIGHYEKRKHWLRRTRIRSIHAQELPQPLLRPGVV